MEFQELSDVDVAVRVLVVLSGTQPLVVNHFGGALEGLLGAQSHKSHVAVDYTLIGVEPHGPVYGQ